MDKETVKALAMNPPEMRMKGIVSLAEAQAHIAEIEDALGFHRSRPITTLRNYGMALAMLRGSAKRKANAPEPKPALASDLNLDADGLPKLNFKLGSFTPPAAPAASAKPTMDLAALTALHTFILGSPATHQVIANTENFRHGVERMNAARDAVEQARQKHGSNSEEVRRADEAVLDLCATLRKEREGTDSEKCTRLIQSFASRGITSIPGVSFAGIRVNVNNTSDRLDARDLATANEYVHQFCSAISGDVDALQAQGGAAHAAMKFMIESGRMDKFGNLKL